MIGAQFTNLDMTDGGIDPLGEFFIADNRRVFKTALLFEVDTVIAVVLKALPAVSDQSGFAISFKGRGESLGLFSCALFCPGGRNLKGGCIGLQLLAVGSPAPVDTNGVGNQLAGLVPAFLNISRFCFLLSHEIPYYQSSGQKTSIWPPLLQSDKTSLRYHHPRIHLFRYY